MPRDRHFSVPFQRRHSPTRVNLPTSGESVCPARHTRRAPAEAKGKDRRQVLRHHRPMLAGARGSAHRQVAAVAGHVEAVTVDQVLGVLLRQALAQSTAAVAGAVDCQCGAAGHAALVGFARHEPGPVGFVRIHHRSEAETGHPAASTDGPEAALSAEHQKTRTSPARRMRTDRVDDRQRLAGTIRAVRCGATATRSVTSSGGSPAIEPSRPAACRPRLCRAPARATTAGANPYSSPAAPWGWIGPVGVAASWQVRRASSLACSGVPSRPVRSDGGHRR